MKKKQTDEASQDHCCFHRQEAEKEEDTDNDDSPTDHLSARTPDEDSEGEVASGSQERPRPSTAVKTTAQSSDFLWNY